MLKTFTLSTGRKAAMIDVTSHVVQAAAESGVSDGIVTVFVPHTTAGVTINENADPDVRRDILTRLDAMVPETGDYEHVEGNSPGHIKASLMGSSVSVILSGGRLVLGAWQGIYFCEFDGPRTRKFHVEVRG